MTPMPKTHDPIEDFLAPLLKLGLKFPLAEGHVLWAEDGVWAEQADMDEGLDGEEIAFYTEGLLLEGFGLTWHALAERETPAQVEHILLFFQENPNLPAPAVPDPAEDWIITAQGRWPR